MAWAVIQSRQQRLAKSLFVCYKTFLFVQIEEEQKNQNMILKEYPFTAI